jgi:hypothetical protein
MPKVLNLYIDESGTRHPLKKQGKTPAHGRDWFALGGILINETHEADARKLHAEFCKKWNIENPLHSTEIRSETNNFRWLRTIPQEEKLAFLEELYGLMREMPVIGIACVIDRPGYNMRYKEKFTGNTWMLCKTAFAVLVERAAKIAIKDGYKLRIAPARCNKTEDKLLKSYYDEMCAAGMPFDEANSRNYSPLSPHEFSETLYEFKLKANTSPMSQLADLYLWPICIGGYDPQNRPYKRLVGDGKLIEQHLNRDEIRNLGTKYSCFPEPLETQKPRN